MSFKVTDETGAEITGSPVAGTAFTETTPGFIMTAVEILESGKLYTDAELRKLLSGHLCRCTGYENIFRAVKKTMYRRLGLPMPTEPEA